MCMMKWILVDCFDLWKRRSRAKIRQERGVSSRRLGRRQDFVVTRKCLSAGPFHRIVEMRQT